MVDLLKKVIEAVCRRHALVLRVQRGMHARAERAKLALACPSRGTNDRHGPVSQKEFS
jgi:hypothetical protein